MSETASNDQPIIILPVETMAREWEAKLLLAAFLTHQGGCVIVGNHAHINNRLNHLPADIYVSQTIVKPKRRIFHIIRQLGMRLAAWDEEGLVWTTPAFYRWRRLDEQNWEMLDRFFCWGEVQADVIRHAFPWRTDILRITGNPRQDLYSPRLRPLHEAGVQKIKDEYGDFILVNSNFGSLHSPRIPLTGIEKTEEDIERLARASRHKMEYIRFRQRVFLSLCDLIRKLSEAFPRKTILIRPHPSENPAAWQELAAPLPNVVVRYDHELIPWLLAAEAVIHNGCTTAVETAMLGRPAIEYRAVELPEWESEIVSRASIPASTSDEVIALLRDPQVLQKAMHDVEEMLKPYIAHLNDGLACERIAQELVALLAEPAPATTPLQRLAGRMKCRLRALEKKAMGRLNPHSSASPAYIDKKFPPMTTEEVQETVERLCALVDLPVPHVEQLHDRIWRLSPAGNAGEGS